MKNMDKQLDKTIIDLDRMMSNNVIQCNTGGDLFMATISLRIDDDDLMLIKNYAQLNNLNMSDFIRQTIIEKIEDELDLEAYNKAMQEFKKDSKTFTLDEVERELSK